MKSESDVCQALGKTSTKPSKTLDSNVHWNEIVTYARLALGSGTSVNHAVQNTLLVPEVIHLVTLLAAQGKLFVRTTVYGLALQLFQSLYAMHEEDATLASEVRNILNDIASPEIIRLFGLEQVSKTSEYTSVEVDASEDRETLEQLSRWLLKAVVICSGSTGKCLHVVFRSARSSFLERSGEHLAVALDGTPHCNRIPTITEHPTSRIRCDGSIGVFRCRRRPSVSNAGRTTKFDEDGGRKGYPVRCQHDTLRLQCRAVSTGIISLRRIVVLACCCASTVQPCPVLRVRNEIDVRLLTHVTEPSGFQGEGLHGDAFGLSLESGGHLKAAGSTIGHVF